MVLRLMRTLLLFFVLAIAASVPANGQAIRFDSASYTTSASCVSGKQCPVLALPGTQVNFCQGTPGSLAGCLSSPATTYTNASAVTPCATTSQLTPATGGACLATTDAQGNYGAWLLPGSYGYYLRVPVTAGGGTYGPYPFTVHGDSGGYTLDSLYTALSLACAAAGSGTLAITKPWNAIPSQTLACPVLFLGNGKIQTNTSATVAFTGTVTCPTYQQCFDTTTNSGGLVTFTKQPSNLNPVQWGAVANGTGTGGTDQSTKFQASLASINAAGGGSLFIPYSSNCYVIGTSTVIVSGNTTVYSDSSATCVQKQFGNHGSPVFQAGDGILAGVSNVWFKNFTTDGNKANITGISGDGFNQGIAFAGASNSGTVDMIVKNAYTGGISVACWGIAPATGIGNNVQIINTIVDASRRNNFEQLCGTNTHIIGGQLSNATGGSLSLGLDIEPFAAGQLVTGFSIDGTEIFGNRDGGINISQPYDVTPFMSFVNVNNHGNGGTTSMNAVNFYSGGPSGTLAIIGGMYSGGTTAAVNIAGWLYSPISATLTGGAWGLLVSAHNSNVVLGPGSISGTSYDIAVDGSLGSRVALAGVKLVCSAACIQPGSEPYVSFPMTMLTSAATNGGIAYWPTSSPATGAMSISAKCTTNEGSSPGVNCSNGSIITKIQSDNNAAIGIVGTQSAHDACLVAFNNDTHGICVDPTGTKYYFISLQTFASNAAAVSGGLTRAGMVYQHSDGSLWAVQ